MYNKVYKKYKNKIIDVKNLLKKLKKLNKKIAFCHGVFDVVHPGHISHLTYAKSKADILVVSITCDKFIEKGIYRPIVPENLRAFNLSTFDFVDYVIIDKNPSPNNNLKLLKPEIFAKGFEYNSLKNKKSQEENEIVKSYGGEMIFTPGDIIYSSSRLINLNEPNLRYEKLLNLMFNNNITFQYLKKVLLKFNKVSVHVFGDIIIDEITRTDLIGGQTKTPTLSFKESGKEKFVGGAGIVALHFNEGGAKTFFSTVIGDDHQKKFILDTFKNTKIKLNLIIDKSRPTTTKNVITNGNYRILKVDRVDNSPVSTQMIRKITNFIKKNKANTIVLSDFRHGIFNKQNNDLILSNIPDNVLKVGDSQVASRWGNITDFKNFDLITPNEKEARFSVFDQDSNIGKLSSLLFEKAKCKNLILKLGSRGVFCSSSKINKSSPYFSIDSFVDKLIDPVGSGDALLAYSTMTYKVTKCLITSSIIGSLAASCACEKDGNFPVTIKDILNKLNNIIHRVK